MENGSIANPFKELVLIDAINRAQQLRRAIYVHIDGEPGILRVFPNGDSTKINKTSVMRRRRIVDTTGQIAFASSMVRKR